MGSDASSLGDAFVCFRSHEGGRAVHNNGDGKYYNNG